MHWKHMSTFDSEASTGTEMNMVASLSVVASGCAAGGSGSAVGCLVSTTHGSTGCGGSPCSIRISLYDAIQWSESRSLKSLEASKSQLGFFATEAHDSLAFRARAAAG